MSVQTPVYVSLEDPFPPPRAWEAAPRRRWPFVVLGAVVVAVLTVWGFARLAGDKSVAYASDSPATWRVGHVPALYQTDPQWADEEYAGATIGTSGCGPTCLAAVAIALTGNESLTPSVVAAYSEGNGYVDDGLTAWALMTEGARGLGLSSREEPGTAEAVTCALEAGRPIIASVGPGDFTSSGHFIVLTSLDGDGNVRVMDPNSQPRTRESWDLERVLGQTRGLWSFSA